jgi:two-component system, chemotaxis family, CheB/CheR fusion protein
MELKARDERLRLVAESTRDYAIVTLDPDGRVTSWNKGAELMFGYTESEVLGDHFRHLFVPEDRDAGAPEEELRRALESGRSVDERWHLRKDGSRFYCSGITAPMEEGRTPGFAKIARDLTERQLLERQRDELLDAEKEVRRRLEAANAMRSQFLAIMSHELKNPLNLILLNSELLGRSPEVASSPILSRAIDIIRKTVHGQSQIIDDLLDLSRLNTGKLALNLAEVRCRAVVDRIVEALQQDATRRGVTLSASGDDVAVYADAVRVEQIVWNLVSNAMKFTSSGGSVTVSIDREEDCARLTVTDTGRGIAPDIIDKVFDMFAQGDGKPLTRKEGGLGIGLALVRQLAELHGGRVEAMSAGIGKGAAFTVWLPLYDRNAGPVAPRVPFSNLAGKRVLFVDDSQETLEALSTLLEMTGARVKTASSASAALEEAAAGPFDIVLSDVAMPDMDGLQFIAELRRRQPDGGWIAIAVTGFATSVDAERAIEAGFDAHLGKPLSLERLDDVVTRLGR